MEPAFFGRNLANVRASDEAVTGAFSGKKNFNKLRDVGLSRKILCFTLRSNLFSVASLSMVFRGQGGFNFYCVENIHQITKCVILPPKFLEIQAAQLNKAELLVD